MRMVWDFSDGRGRVRWEPATRAGGGALGGPSFSGSGADEVAADAKTGQTTSRTTRTEAA